MSRKNNTLIISAQIGDELIGCSSLFRERCLWDEIDIFYLTDFSNERLKEAEHFTKTYNCKMYTWRSIPNKVDYFKYKTILVPQYSSRTFAHRDAYSSYIHVATALYSLDMKPAYSICEEHRKWKRETLNHFYPSQKERWQLNPHYWLYENITGVDINLLFHTYSIVPVDIVHKGNRQTAQVRMVSSYVNNLEKRVFSNIQELWIYLSGITVHKFTITLGDQVLEGNV